MESRPIPAFYCCYLLRSTVRHSSLYIGSTPNPARRLAQHNGRLKGGAVKTSRESLRPWEVACIVSGFPSHIAALQFEWAWQNTHLTQHIPDHQRITEPRSVVRKSSRTGRTRRRPSRPPMSLANRLANLHLLLRVDSFRAWPLDLTFFCQDVYQVWRTWSDRVHGSIRHGIRVVLDSKSDLQAEQGQKLGGGAVLENDEANPLDAVDVGYTKLRPYLQKSISLLDDIEGLTCAVCKKPLAQAQGSLAVCPKESCAAVSHLTCLSGHFVRSKQGNEEVLLPTEGSCPTCKDLVRWIDMVKELSMRTRGGKDLEKLLKEPRKRRVGRAKGTLEQTGNAIDDSDKLSTSDELYEADDRSTQKYDAASAVSAEDDWRYLDEDQDDMMSVTSVNTDGSEMSFREGSPGRSRPLQSKKLEMVIEDSEWDGAEVLD